MFGERTTAVLFREFVILVVSLALEIYLHSRPDVGEKWAITWAISTGLLLTLLSLAFEVIGVPDEFRALLPDMAGAARTAGKNHVMKIILTQIISELRADVKNLNRNTYIDERGTIPKLSVKTIESVASHAFATFIVDEREVAYSDENGRAYLNAWFSKAQEIGTPGKLVRLFIVENRDDVSAETVDLIERHIQNKISVFTMERAKAEKLCGACEMDFGLFDSDCLMTVRARHGISPLLTVYVQTDRREISKTFDDYIACSESLKQSAMPGEQFLREFNAPINARFWDNRLLNHSTRLGVPHGLSDQDANNMLTMAVTRLPQIQELRVAILGLTPQLIDACNAEPRVKEVILVDQTAVKQDFAGKIKRVTDNWLEFKGDHGFDAILGDEALNNLSIPQYGHFFRAMHGCLKGQGALVLRTLARYDDAERLAHIPTSDLLEEIKKWQPGGFDSEVGPRILELLHSSNIAFDPSRSLIETSRYNDLIRTWLEQKSISSQQADAFWFPYKQAPKLRLSSPVPDQIREASRQFFDPVQMIKVDQRYCGNDGSLASLYRITPFVVKS